MRRELFVDLAAQDFDCFVLIWYCRPIVYLGWDFGDRTVEVIGSPLLDTVLEPETGRLHLVRVDLVAKTIPLFPSSVGPARGSRVSGSYR